ncbi:MAG: TauD/TfdA family dioxygenase [Proteobacteria bacterium]|nr:TauD/TfdA family dioxygenase [Burkholderiales bacterium]
MVENTSVSFAQSQSQTQAQSGSRAKPPAVPGIRPITPVVGAEVTGVDLAEVTDEAFAQIQRAWLAHSALLFRDQSLSDADLVAFSRRFGTLDQAPVNENGRMTAAAFPEIYVVSNIKGADGKPIGSLGAGEAVWHTDMSYLPVPPDASLLYSKEVPPEGGDTWIVSMEAALAALPADLSAAIVGRSIKHDGTYNSGGYLREGLRASDNPMDSVGTPHPIVCAHPETGRPTLYLGRRRNAYVIGLPVVESEALLDRLWAVIDQPGLSFAHRWRVGDVLMWDNRSTMHRRDPFDPESRRLMHRTQIGGKVAPQPGA